MHACVLERVRAPLRLVERPALAAAPGQLRLAVTACAVCRTDLHVVDGELPAVPLPVIPGHEIVGRVLEVGAGVTGWRTGERVGVPWLGWACGQCAACERGEENLCPTARYTGYQLDGGFASEALVDARFALRMPEALRRSRGGTAPVRRSDRLARARGGGDGGASRPVRVRSGGAHRGAGGACTRAGNLRLRTSGRFGGDGIRALTGCALGRGFRPVATAAPRCRHPVRAGRRARAAGAARGASRRHGRVRRDPHERYPGLSVQHPVGRAHVALGGQPDAAGCARVLRVCAVHPITTTTVAYPLAAVNDALAALRAGRLQGAAVLEP